jgi:hypothetical protein
MRLRNTRWLSVASVVLMTALMTAAIALPASAQKLAPTKEGEPTKGKPSQKAQAKASAQVRIVGEAEEEPEPYDVLSDVNEDTWLALAGWSSKYRIGLGVSHGDWVRYEVTGDAAKEMVEIRAERMESGDIWLIETHSTEGSDASSEIHMHFAAGKPQLLEAFRVDEKGEKHQYDIPDAATAAELVVATRDRAVEVLTGELREIRIVDCEGREDLTGPFGTLSCQCLDVRVAGDTSPLSLDRFRPWEPEGTTLWFSERVPRLVPIGPMLLPALISPDEAMLVRGGMVRGPGYELVDYSGHIR